MNEIKYFPSEPMYAIAYVPYSRFEEMYTPEKAFERGTIFKKLDIPFSAYANIPIMNPFC